MSSRRALVAAVALLLGVSACQRDRASGAAADSAASPYAPPPLTDSNAFTTVAAGGASFACGLTVGGAVWCWGSNRSGELAIGSNDARPHPSPARVTGGPYRQLVAGNAFACALAEGGQAWCWGANTDSQVGAVPADPCREGEFRNPCVTRPAAVGGEHVFRAIAAGGTHACGLDSAGAAWCWGGNLFQEHSVLGRGSPGECRVAVRGEGGGEVETMPCGSLLPVRVAGAPSLSRLASSSGHTCGVAADGAAYCWGRAGHGQLGHGSIERVDSAVRVTAATAVREIAPLGNSTCALDAEGGLWCWGQAEYGRLGLDSAPDRCPVRWSAGAPVRNVPCALRPQRVAPGTAFRALASGATSGCAIATGGVLWCWPGGGEAAAIGLSRDSTSVVPRRLWPERRFRAAARGVTFTCGVTEAGAALCWGWNDVGQLGAGRVFQRSDTAVVVARTPG